MTTNFPVVSRGAADSVAAPTEGWADVTTTTTSEEVNLSAYGRRYVYIEATGDDHYIIFTNTSGQAIVTGTAATVGTAAVPRLVPVGAGRGISVVVPEKYSIMRYRAVSGTGALRVTRT